MQLQGITPVFTTRHLAAARDFYVRHFGFELSFDHDRFVGLRAGAKGSLEIGFMAPDEMAPDTSDGRGASLVFQVADVDAAHAALKASGAPIVSPPTDQPWGARQMVTRDPIGVVLYVSHPIPIATELAAHVR